MEVGSCPTYRTQRVLTHKVTDGGQLPVFLHAHITTVAGFKCHPPAMPFHFKHGVGRTEGRTGNISERGEQNLVPFSSMGSRDEMEACPPQKHPWPVGATPHPGEHLLFS